MTQRQYPPVRRVIPLTWNKKGTSDLKSSLLVSGAELAWPHENGDEAGEEDAGQSLVPRDPAPRDWTVKMQGSGSDLEQECEGRGSHRLVHRLPACKLWVMSTIHTSLRLGQVIGVSFTSWSDADRFCQTLDVHWALLRLMAMSGQS